MYQAKNTGIREPWATIERWCGPLKHTTWNNLFGTVVISIFDGERYRYSIPLENVETIVGWGREEFLVQLAWRRHRQEIPLPDDLERHILLPGIGLLGARLNAYIPQAAPLDEVFTRLTYDSRKVLLPDSWFIVYRRVPSPTPLRWAMRKVSVVLYHGPGPWDIPVYSEKMTRYEVD
jgi:hypothetical protein